MLPSSIVMWLLCPKLYHSEVDLIYTRIIICGLLLVFFSIGLSITPNVFADSTRTQNFDGIDGWSCYTDGVFSCNGPNKYPITVKQSDTEGRPTPVSYTHLTLPTKA